jgi:hypothetical protein
LIPALKTGDPFTLGEGANSLRVIVLNSSVAGTGPAGGAAGLEDVGDYRAVRIGATSNSSATLTVQPFSERGILGTYTPAGAGERIAGVSADGTADITAIIIDLQATFEDLKESLMDTSATDGVAFNYINYDLRSFEQGTGKVDIWVINSTSQIIDTNDNKTWCTTAATGTTDCGAILAVDQGDSTGYNLIGQGIDGVVSSDGGSFISELFAPHTEDTDNIGLFINFTSSVDIDANDETTEAFVIDFFSFGFTDDGVQSAERVANQIVRIEAEETGDNTSTFEGSLEYIMVNQINIQSNSTFGDITTIANDPGFIVIEDLTDEDAPRVSYNDLGQDGVVTPVSDQEEAPSHSGVVSLNQDSYKIADTVVITLEDLDLNVDSDLIDIFTVVASNTGATEDQVGSATTQTLSFGELGRLLDVTYDDIQWETPDPGTCTDDG